MSDTVPTMLTIKETAQRTNLAEHYIRGLCLQNKIVHVLCGRKYLINFERFIDFLNEGEKAPEPPQGIIRRIG